MEKDDHKKLSDVVIREIQKMILNGELTEGDKLPPEREMTERFGIGRPALREALKSLEMLGLVERRHGLGNFIVNRVQSSYFEPLSLSFVLNHGTMREVHEMRSCLELYTARKAAEAATPTDILSLHSNLKQMIAADTPQAKSVYDRAFHLELVRIANNTLLYNMVENLSYLMDHFIERSVQISYFEGDSIENIYREHEKIITAVSRHDPQSAEDAMAAHLSNIKIAQI